MKFLGVTACPSGVAHTYMAAEALQKAAEKKGIEMKVETQGSIGAANVISEADVQSADAVILTTDMPILHEERFKGKPIVRVSTTDCIKRADAILVKIIDHLNKK